MNTKLTKADVRYIRRSNTPDRVLAEELGVKRLAVFRARTGKTFQNVKVRASFRLTKQKV